MSKEQMDDTQGAGLEFNHQVLALCGNAKSSSLLRVCTIHPAPLPCSAYWAPPAQVEERTLWFLSLEDAMMFFIFNSAQLLCSTRAKQTAKAIKKFDFFSYIM